MLYTILVIFYISMYYIFKKNTYSQLLIKLTNIFRKFQFIFSFCFFILILVSIFYVSQIVRSGPASELVNGISLLFFMISVPMFIITYFVGILSSRKKSLEGIFYFFEIIFNVYFSVKLFNGSERISDTTNFICFCLGILLLIIPIHILSVSVRLEDDPLSNTYSLVNNRTKRRRQMTVSEVFALDRMEEEENFYLKELEPHFTISLYKNYVNQDNNPHPFLPYIRNFFQVVEDNNLIRDKHRLPLKNPDAMIRNYFAGHFENSQLQLYEIVGRHFDSFEDFKEKL